MRLPVVVLGATGSIGTQTLEVADSLGVEVRAVAANRPSAEFVELANRYPNATVVVGGGSPEERDVFQTSVRRPVQFGDNAVVEAATSEGVTVVNGIVGAAGLRSTIAALEAGNRLALANKESLVAAGPVVNRVLEHSGELVPVDSEHSALYQCLHGEPSSAVARLVLTASGGPFRGRSRESLADVTPEEALRHPTWDMGRRITIDSATMFNKGLEIIEAHYLFDVPYDKIDVVVHPQSILHSAVEFVDGSWKGHFGQPDMRIPIQYALTAPSRAVSSVEPFSLTGRSLEFEEPDREVFEAIDLAFIAGEQGGSAPAVLNAADEVAVEAFLDGMLGFLGIADIVRTTLERVEWRELETVDDVLGVDTEARSVAADLVSRSI